MTNMTDGKKDFFDYISPFTRKYVKPCVDWTCQSKFHMVAIIIVLVLIVLFASVIKQSLIISFLILLGGVSKIYQRYVNAQIGVEFIMLSTVVGGFVYGSLIGGIIGFVTFALASYFSGRWSHNLFPSFIMVTIIGMISKSFSNVTTAGIVLTLIYDVLLGYIYLAWFRGRIYRILMFTLTHFLWNVYVFIKLAPLLYSWLI